MMGPKQEAQAALFYEFFLEDHGPQAGFGTAISAFANASFSTE